MRRRTPPQEPNSNWGDLINIRYVDGQRIRAERVIIETSTTIIYTRIAWTPSPAAAASPTTPVSPIFSPDSPDTYQRQPNGSGTMSPWDSHSESNSPPNVSHRLWSPPSPPPVNHSPADDSGSDNDSMTSQTYDQWGASEEEDDDDDDDELRSLFRNRR